MTSVPNQFLKVKDESSLKAKAKAKAKDKDNNTASAIPHKFCFRIWFPGVPSTVAAYKIWLGFSRQVAVSYNAITCVFGNFKHRIQYTV